MSDSVQPHRWQPTRLPCPWDFPGKNTGVGCHFLLQCLKIKSESEVVQSCPTLSNAMDYSPPGPPSMGFSRQEYWSGVPLPSPKLINTKEFLSLIQTVHFSPSSSFSSSSSSSGSSEFSLGLFSSSSSCFLFCSSFFFFLFSFLFSLLAARACFLLSSLDCE